MLPFPGTQVATHEGFSPGISGSRRLGASRGSLHARALFGVDEADEGCRCVEAVTFWG